MTVQQLLANTDSEELSEWMGYFDIEDPEMAAWQRTSVICATTHNMANLTGRGRYPKQVKGDHYMPKPKKRVQTATAQIATLKALFGQG